MRQHVRAWLTAAVAAYMAGSVACGSTFAQDWPPVVDSAVEGVRKVPQGYLVTPAALIPFTAEVRDDRGLTRLTYVVALAPLGRDGKPGKEEEHAVPVAGLAQLLRRREGKSPPQDVREFRLKPTDAISGLDLDKLPLKSHPRFGLRVWLEATDNHVGTPQTRRDGPFTFVVVSEGALLSEIANEEEDLESRLQDVKTNRLQWIKSKLEKLNQGLAATKPENIPALRERAAGVMAVFPMGDVAKTFERSSEIVGDIHTDFRNILRELKANRIHARMIERIEKTVCEPLNEALRREYAQASEALNDLRTALERSDADEVRKATATATERLNALDDRLRKVFEALRELEKENRLFKLLRDTEDGIR